MTIKKGNDVGGMYNLAELYEEEYQDYKKSTKPQPLTTPTKNRYNPS